MKKILALAFILSLLVGCAFSGSNPAGIQAASVNDTSQTIFKVNFGEETPDDNAPPPLQPQPKGWGQMTYDQKSGNLIYQYEINGIKYQGVFEPANKFSPKVQVEITFDPASQIYTYTYKVSNLAGPQSIDEFSFINNAKIIQSNNNVGWSDPIGPSPSNPYAVWVDTPKAIVPGKSGTFTITSQAPPGIVSGRLAGEPIQPYSGDKLGDEPIELINYRLDVLNSSKFAYIQFHMPGPAPVAQMTSGQFVDYIIEMKNRSLAYEWLTAVISRQLDEVLKPVKSASAGNGDLIAAAQAAMIRLDELKQQSKLKNKLYQLLKGDLEFLTVARRGNLVEIPRYPLAAESCRENMEVIGLGIEAFYKNYDRFPRSLNEILPGHYVDRVPKCPIDGSAYTYQWCTLPWGYTITCPACHDGGRAGAVQYSSGKKPKPAVELNNPGN